MSCLRKKFLPGSRSVVLPLVTVLVLISAGCATIADLPKRFLGISIKDLQSLRQDSSRARTYLCSFDECFNSILNLATNVEPPRLLASEHHMDIHIYPDEIDDEDSSRDEEDFGIVKRDEDQGLYYVFMQNRVKGYIVVMKIPGHVDTTEAGIFLREYGEYAHTIEITSLSTNARDTVAEEVFRLLGAQYNEVN